MDFKIDDFLWLIQSIGVLFGVVFTNWVLKKIVHNFKEDAHGWRTKLDLIIFSPMRFILWVLGVTYVFMILNYHFEFVDDLSVIIRIREIGVFFGVTWIVLRWKKVMQVQLISHVDRSKHDPATLEVIFRLVTMTIVVIAALVILQISGINVMPLLAFGGIGAAAIGFAAKDVLANFFGGMMLFINRPFLEGDVILLFKDNIEGSVERIGWYTTTIRDKNTCPVYLPNAILISALVINRSRRSHRAIEETLSIRYTDADRISELSQELRNMLMAHPDIDQSRPILIGTDSLGDYALRVSLKMYTSAISDPDYTRVQEEVLLKVNALLQRAGVEMPIPTQSITVVSPNNLISGGA